MKHFYHYLLIVFLAGQAPVWGQNATEKKHILVNDSITVDLPEVFVKAERPLVKVSEGKLQYDIPNLVKDKPVDNAFDVIGELPGIQKEGDKVSIIGTPSTSILINGRKSSMTAEQLAGLLKSTSSSKVKQIDVMYSTPPRFGVKGASINVVIENDKSLKDVLKGEISLTGKQGYFFSPSGQANLSYIGKNYSADISYSAAYNHRRQEEEMTARPTVNDRPYDIRQDDWYNNVSLSHNIRGAFDFDLKNKDRLSLSYTGRFYDPDKVSRRGALTEFVDIQRVETELELSGASNLHNARMDYIGHKGFSAGMDYTFYKNDDKQHLVNDFEKEEEQTISTLSSQQVQRANLYMNDSRKLKKEWMLDYGLDASFSDTRNESGQSINGGKAPEGTFRLKQKDYSMGAFAGFTKQFGKKVSLNASLSLQYYKASVDSAGKKKTLWNRVSLFPQLNFTYKVAPSGMLMFSFSSDKTYPSYWMTTPNTYYMNVYSSIIGNPDLKPQLSYSMQLNYILKSKYVFGLFTNIQPDKIQQMTYQRHDELRAVFQTVNMDIYNMYGAVAVIPFRPFDFMSSRLTLMGCAIHNKGTLYDVSFDRKKLFGRAELNNTFYLTKDRNLSLELRGYCISPVIQGLYDVDLIYNVSAGLTWTFAKKKMRLTVRGNDLFEGGNPVTHVDEQGQKSRMKLWQDSRNVTLTLRYSFGGYKEKKAKEVDTSRLGTGI
ncbi:outer membrane beta-barrel family protein [uncultured Parabacteroides sp.]|uniref:outer membrane beta-barrel family protein n=1 Tax=uncultured Parabacteroides sp. TaxID=512312 RepID=UPI00280556FD|nr:outer membrane beta-barrel family protein [uncultured Parabacteroides sp.]